MVEINLTIELGKIWRKASAFTTVPTPSSPQYSHYGILDTNSNLVCVFYSFGYMNSINFSIDYLTSIIAPFSSHFRYGSVNRCSSKVLTSTKAIQYPKEHPYRNLWIISTLFL